MSARRRTYSCMSIARRHPALFQGEEGQVKPCEHRGFVVAFPMYRCIRCGGLFKRGE